MASKEEKRYLELQMEELKEAYANKEDENPAPKKNDAQHKKNLEIAKLYEDAAEYEEDLKAFEKELEVVLANKLKDIPDELLEKSPSEERDFTQEIKNLLEATWTHYVEVEKSHPQEQLDIIKNSTLSEVVENLDKAYPDVQQSFEDTIKKLLITRWETLIAIKKEHIKEEIAEIKIMGLKPNYVQRIYKQFHGIQ